MRGVLAVLCNGAREALKWAALDTLDVRLSLVAGAWRLPPHALFSARSLYSRAPPSKFLLAFLSFFSHETADFLALCFCAFAPLRLYASAPLPSLCAALLSAMLFSLLCTSLCAALLWDLLFWSRLCLSLVAPDLNRCKQKLVVTKFACTIKELCIHKMSSEVQ